MTNLLIIDDDPDFRNSVAEILGNDGLEIHQAASGSEGLVLLDRHPYNLVLLDLVLPDMDGLSVLREIRRQNDQVKVIMITAFATIESAVEGIKLGANDVLAKPFRIAEFRTLIHRTLEEQRLEQQVRKHNLDHLLGCVTQPIRKAVVEVLDHHPALRMNDLLRELAITDHAKLSFHLNNLLEQGVIVKSADRLYTLTPLGKKLMAGLRNLSLFLDKSKL